MGQDMSHLCSSVAVPRAALALRGEKDLALQSKRTFLAHLCFPSSATWELNNHSCPMDLFGYPVEVYFSGVLRGRDIFLLLYLGLLLDALVLFIVYFHRVGAPWA